MNRQFDPLTVALTGQLSIVLITAAILALVVSLFILWRYRRAVIKSMRRRSRSEILESTGHMPPEEPHRPPDTALVFDFASASAKSNLLYRSGRRRPWLAALIYAVAGACFAATMATAFLLSTKMALLPWRFLYLTWVNAWPVVLTTNLVATVTRRGQMIVLAIYLIGGIALSGSLLARSPDLTIVQLIYLWFDANAVPSLLLLFFLNRRIRAVGPLVLVFMIFGAAGATLLVSVAGNNPKLLRAIGDFARSLGLGATGTVWGLHLLGFTLFGIAGWLILDSLRQMYERKQISDQTVTIDAIWLLFGTVNSIGLVFEGARWILSGLVAFVIFKLVAAIGFRLLHARRDLAGPRLLLLRVFALGRRSQRLYDALGKRWRAVGSIQMIAGPDLATTAVELHEFLDFIAGKLARRFIDSGQSLDLRISQMDVEADGDGRFRVSEFFCHDDTWKLALGRLADESDAVLMDLRGFSQLNDGCIFEINELFNQVPLQRVVFVIDDSTDQEFMRETMKRAWRQIKERSPNRRLSPGRVSLVQLSRWNAGGIRTLLHAISVAASGLSPREPTKPSTAVSDPQEFSW
ncbi:MAG: hypothetical protein ACREQ2_23495 [Candidatus Binatia bacterium]